MASINNVQISLIDNGEHFRSPENPLIYSGYVKDCNVNVTVIVPFHSNVYPNVDPTITVTTSEDGNDVMITPSYNTTTPLSTVYTQVVKIGFTLADASLSNDGSATINVTVDEEGRPDTNPHMLGEPKRGTKIIAQPQN